MATKIFRRLFSASANLAQQSTASQIEKIVPNNAKKFVEVTWANNEKSRFDYVWLRDNCPSEHTYHITSRTKARKLKLKDLDLNIVPTKIEMTDAGLHVEWPGQQDGFYSNEWLHDRDISSSRVRGSRHEIFLKNHKYWNAEEFKPFFRYRDFNKLLEDDLYLHDCLTELTETGLVFFRGAKQQKGELHRMAKRLGHCITTHYGDCFPIEFENEPTNLAYTDIELELHTDLCFVNPPPDVQMLHCVKAAGQFTGKSIFSDGFRAAQIVKETRPDLYKILSTVRLEYCDEGRTHLPYDHATTFPVINLDDNGKLDRIIYNSHCRTWFVDHDDVQKFYEGIKYFLEVASRPEHTFKVLLEPGDIAFFDNNRIMHGRDAFVVEGKMERILQGMYFTWDTVKSQVRLLRDKHDIKPNWISV